MADLDRSVVSYFPLAGETGNARSSRFASWAPYTLNGALTEEVSLSQGHAFRDGHWSGGGPWTLTRDRTTYQLGSANTDTCVGPVMLATPTTSWSGAPAVFPPKSELELNAMGSTAMARCEPTNPSFSLSNTLGELRQEGLPRLPDVRTRSAVDAARKSGGNYLNVEFGWMPLVRDLRSFATAVRTSDEVLKNYHQGSAKPQHRGYSFEPGSRIGNRSAAFAVSPGVASLGFAQGSELHRTSQSVWFSGRFMYHLPSSNDQLGKFHAWGSDARKLLGLELTPEVVWNLAPWSWAADWFGNTGDVMHNVSALGRDGMVMSYGYVMCHTRKETHRAGSNPNYGSVGSLRVEESKLRRAATPYGFGVDMHSLSNAQFAILAALGLSRV